MANIKWKGILEAGGIPSLCKLINGRVHKAMPTKRTYELLACIALITGLGTPFAWAQSEDLSLHYASEVFPSRSHGGHWQSWKVEVSEQGPLVVGNGNRLVVFDGSSWQSLPSPNNTRIRDVLIDGDQIWIGAESDFGRYRPDADGVWFFESLRPESGQIRGAFTDIWNVRKTDSAVWFNARTHLFRWSDDAGTQVFYPVTQLRGIEVLDSRLLALHANVGLVDPLQDVNLAVSNSEILASATLSASRQTEHHGSLVLTRESGLWQWHDAQLQPVLSGDHPALAATVAFDLLEWPDGRLLLSHTRGISVLSRNLELLDRIDDSSGLPTNIVLSMSRDRDHGLWLAQPGYLTRVMPDLPLRYVQLSGELRFNTNQARVIDQTWWLATDQGLWKQHDDGQFISIPGPRLMTWGPVPHRNGALVPTNGGVYWIADRQQPAGPESAFLLELPYAYEILPSKQFPGRFFVASDKGLMLLEDSQGEWVQAGPFAGIEVRPTQMLEDNDGTLWMGSGVQTLYRVQFPESGALEPIQVQRFDDSHGLPPGNVLPVMLDGQVRLGTTEGLWRIESDASASEFTFGIDPSYDGPFQQGDVFRLLEINRDEVFLRVGNQTGRAVRRHGRWDWQDDFFNAIVPNRTNFFAASPDGRVLSNVGNDLVLLEARDWHVPDHSSSLILGPTIADDQRIGSALSWLRVNNELDFDAPQSIIRTNFALPTLTGQNRIRYRSRLRGLNDRWSDWSDENWREFTQLDGGRYQLEVEAIDSFGRQTQAELLELNLPSPWYLTPIAWVAYALLFLLSLLTAALLGQRWRSQQLLARKVELEQQVSLKTRQLRDEAKAREHFFTTMSHEFRTPLTLMLAPLESLVSETTPSQLTSLNQSAPEAQRQRSLLELVRSNALRMKSLIDELLDFNRLRATPNALHLRPMDLNELLRKRTALVQPATETKQIKLDLHLPNDPVPAMIDALQFEKVLFNVLGNAVKFTPRGGNISVGLTSGQQFSTVSICDTGPGLAEDEFEAVFDLYHVGRHRIKDGAGSGVGLALCRTLIEQHRGHISAIANEPQGLCIRIELPAAEFEPVDEPIVDTQLRFESESPEILAAGLPSNQEDEDSDKPGLLIIDDNPDLRHYLTMLLGQNYRISAAADAETGLKLAKTTLPDVVISDWMMPGMSGLEMLTELRADPELGGLPVLLLSARFSRGAAIEALSAGADDYMSKPFHSAELIARIESLRATRRRVQKTLAAERRQSIDGQVRDSFSARVQACIEANYTRSNFKVTTLAELLHMDRSTLYRKCQDALQTGPGELLLHYRLKQARRLLTEHRHLVGDTAYAVGFESRCYFSRAYRKHFGHSPGQDARS